MRLSTVILAVLALAGAAPAGAPPQFFVITKDGFVPNSITIYAGETTSWTNRDARPHRVAGDRGEFVSPLLRAGQTFRVKFETPGTVGFHDPLARDSTGSVVVGPAPASLTIAASRAVVPFEGRLVLSGVVSNNLAGEPVVVLARSFGQDSFTTVSAEVTASGGRFVAVVRAQSPSTYRAEWRGATSPEVVVRMRPTVTLAERRGLLDVDVGVPTLLSGSAGYVQRRAGERWVRLRRFVFDQSTAHGLAAELPRGPSVLRVYLPHDQVGPGFLDAFSPPLRVTR